MHHACNVELVDYPEVREYIYAHANVEGLGGVRCTSIFHATHPLFVPVVEYAHEWHRQVWRLPEPDPRPAQAWGIRMTPGQVLPRHSHPAQRYSVLYYVSFGAALYVDDERIEIEPGLMITFDGRAEHWTDAQPNPFDRYCMAMAFG